MNDKAINPQEIIQISEKEFKKQFSKWLMDKELTRELQAKLRKNLIENFNSTRLGKKINAEYNQSQKVFSPLNLILSSLVAEFLYAQNCHYSLSVFCTEVPHQNILPNFEKETNFRFSKEDLMEIFAALDGNFNEDLKNHIINNYMKLEHVKKNQNSSCLFVIFEAFFKKKLMQPKIFNAEETVNLSKENKVRYRISGSKTKHSSNKIKTHKQNFKFLRKYVILLTKKLKEVYLYIYNLGKKNDQLHEAKSSISIKIEQFNGKLDKIVKLLRLLSFTKRNKNNTSSVLSAINGMSKQFEIYAKQLENILQKDVELKSSTHLNKKKYGDWVSDTQNTEFGKCFLMKIESSIQKLLKKERQRMLHAFTEKLENEKKNLKLKYRQQYLSCITKSKFSLKEGNNEENLHAAVQSQCSKKQDTFSPIKNSEIYDKEGNEKILKSRKRNEVLEKNEKILTKLSPQLHDMANLNLLQKERDADNVIFEAKLKIQELELESIKIDNTFMDNLIKQQKNKFEERQSLQSIWEKYNLEMILKKKCNVLHNHHSILSNPKLMFKETFKTTASELLEDNIDTKSTKILSSDDIEPIEHLEFENPFKNFQLKILSAQCQNLENKERLTTNNFNDVKCEISSKFLSSIENVLQSNLKYQKNYNKGECPNTSPKFLQFTKEKGCKTSEQLAGVSSTTISQFDTIGNISLANSSYVNEQQNIKTNHSNEQLINSLTKNACKVQTQTNSIFQISSFSKNEDVRNLESPLTTEIKTQTPTKGSYKENEMLLTADVFVGKSNSNNSNTNISVLSTKNESL